MSIGIVVVIGLGIVMLIMVLGLIARILVIEKSPVQEEPIRPLDEEDPGDDLDGTAPPDLDTPNLVDLYSEQSEESDKKTAEVLEAQTDHLTNLPTGAHFFHECKKMLSDACAAGETMAVVYFDFNRFKLINSLKGVSTGDYALQKISAELPEIFGNTSKFTRISADHFMILMPYLDEAQISDCANRMKSICRDIMESLGAKTGLNVSIGVAITQNSTWGYHLPVLIQQANIAHYTIKTNRQVPYIFYNSAMVTSFLYGESALENFKENQFTDEFVMYYQSRKELKNQRLAGAQALIRWKILDEIARREPLNAENGTLPGYSTKVLYKVCKEMSTCRKEGIRYVPVAVSLSMIDLYKSDVDAVVGRCLDEFQVEPRMLELIFDAEELPVEMETSIIQLQKLKDLGVRLTLNNINPNSDTLLKLTVFPFNRLQLRRGFLREFDNPDDAKNQVLSLNSVIAYARTYNMQVLCEGVQLVDHAEFLQALGCKYGQGSYYGTPMPVERFNKYLREQSGSISYDTHDAPVDAESGFAEAASGEYQQLDSADIIPIVQPLSDQTAP